MITHDLTHIVAQAFKVQGLPEELGRVTPSDRPDLADFQCNGAMQAARLAKKNPREIAQNIIDALQESDTQNVFETIQIAGPGFLNFKLNKEYLAGFVGGQSAHEKMGYKQEENQKKIIIDFCGANVAKALHVGHIRPTLVGDHIIRILRYAGHTVLGDTHLGDWGMPMGMLINEIQKEQPDLIYFDENYDGEFSAESPVTIDDLARLYPQGSKCIKEDEDELLKVRKITAKMQDGHPPYVALLKHFISVSVEDLKKKTDFLGVNVDLWLGESDTQPVMKEMFADLLASGLAVDNDGAKVIHVAQDDDKNDMPPLILEKSDGGYTYGTTDLATLYMRRRDHDPDQVIYVVDQRQALHFQQLFRAAKKSKYAEKMDLLHIGFGTINGKDGKPFKTRDGGVPTLEFLINSAMNKAIDRMETIGLDQKLSAQDFQLAAQKIAVAALRFADASNAPRSDYIFDLDKFVSFEGKTGPYLQYAAVRIKALVDKATQAGFKSGELVLDDVQTPVSLAISQFPEAVQGAVEHYAPNILCDYLFNLAQKANTFYQNAPVLKEEDASKRDSYLALLNIVYKVLEQGLDLIGIEIPQQM